jgi:hypothetical protein
MQMNTKRHSNRGTHISLAVPCTPAIERPRA